MKAAEELRPAFAIPESLAPIYTLERLRGRVAEAIAKRLWIHDFQKMLGLEVLEEQWPDAVDNPDHYRHHAAAMIYTIGPAELEWNELNDCWEAHVPNTMGAYTVTRWGESEFSLTLLFDDHLGLRYPDQETLVSAQSMAQLDYELRYWTGSNAKEYLGDIGTVFV